MIHINKLKKDLALDTVLFLAAEPNHNFYLCGSQLWGSCGADSDFDLAAADTPEVRVFLVENNFTYRDKSNNYNDGNTNCVYERGSIDVILVVDLDLRLAFQDYIINNNIIIPKKDSAFCKKIYDDLRSGLYEHRKISI